MAPSIYIFLAYINSPKFYFKNEADTFELLARQNCRIYTRSAFHLTSPQKKSKKKKIKFIVEGGRKVAIDLALCV